MTAILLAAVIMTTGNDDFLAERQYIRSQELRYEAVEAAQSDESGAEVETVAEDDESLYKGAQRTYYGACRITFYCSCSQCCGQWAGGATASGKMPTAGWTVANGSLPFGTLIEIDGHTYCVEDRGVDGNQFDIYVDSHQEALNRGLYYADVYLIG